MEFVDHLLLGCQVALNLNNLIYCFVGVVIGTLVGVLPGIGPAGAVALLLPATFGLNPASAIIMLAGIYYGCQYGGSTTSILVNIPGESSSVVTCLDGYQMAKQGRAGPALGIAAFGSYIAGTIGVVILMFLALPLASVALKFGPPEYTALIILGLTILSYLARGSMLKAIIMAVLGIGISLIGTDMISGRVRFTFGIMELEDGIGMIPIVMGLFGIAEVLSNLEESVKLELMQTKIRGLLPNWKDWKDSIGAILRGTFLGFFLGILPGGGAVLSSFVTYAFEKKVSKHPEKFGTGVIEGVAAPEAANNAATAGAFIPFFTLGIPSNAVMALLLGAMMIHGLNPGPMLLRQNPDIFWGTVISMYIGNIMLLILNLPLIGIWVKVTQIPYRILFPLIFFFCVIGSYSVSNSITDVFLMLSFGIIGYLFRKFEYEPAPLVLAYILGPMLENTLRQSLLMSGGSFEIFLSRPVSLGIFIAVLLVLTSNFIPVFKKKRQEVAQ